MSIPINMAPSRGWSALAGLAICIALTASPLASDPGSATTLPVSSVDSVGMTVSDMSEALRFYTGVLPFEKVSDSEHAGRETELLTGVFGTRTRVVRLRLGGSTPYALVLMTDSGARVTTSGSQIRRQLDRGRYVVAVQAEIGAPASAYTLSLVIRPPSAVRKM